MNGFFHTEYTGSVRCPVCTRIYQVVPELYPVGAFSVPSRTTDKGVSIKPKPLPSPDFFAVNPQAPRRFIRVLPLHDSQVVAGPCSGSRVIARSPFFCGQCKALVLNPMHWNQKMERCSVCAGPEIEYQKREDKKRVQFKGRLYEP